MDKNYGGVIWTNHVLQRLKDRGIKQGDAWVTWKRPDKSQFARSRGAWVYYRTFGNKRIEVVAKQNDKKEWLIVSVWAKQILKHRKKQERKGFIDRIIKTLLKK